MQLVIGNKRYSSWSLRPWILMTYFGIPFEERLILLGRPTTSAAISAVSPSGRVPCLIDRNITVWESLAIIEYLAEKYPEHAIWPQDRAARAVARAISCEMHAGFSGLRNACPMNLCKTFPARDYGTAATADVARIEALWRDARSRFAAGGPFLFGAFSGADAMYAPVVLRLTGYNWSIAADTQAYVDAISQLPAMQAWKAAAAEETAIVAADEIDE